MVSVLAFAPLRKRSLKICPQSQNCAKETRWAKERNKCRVCAGEPQRTQTFAALATGLDRSGVGRAHVCRLPSHRDRADPVFPANHRARSARRGFETNRARRYPPRYPDAMGRRLVSLDRETGIWTPD